MLATACVTSPPPDAVDASLPPPSPPPPFTVPEGYPVSTLGLALFENTGPAEPEDTETAEPAPRPLVAPVVDTAIQQAYDAVRPKSIVDLQRTRVAVSAEITDGTRSGTATLTGLAPLVGRSMLLDLAWDDGTMETFHLERRVTRDTVSLTPQGLAIAGPGGETACTLWTGSPRALDAARASKQSHAPLCNGRLTLRVKTDGRKTHVEWTSDFLRDNVPGGERITTFVRDTLFKDAHRTTAATEQGATTAPELRGGPPAPQLDPALAGSTVTPPDLGLPLDGVTDGKLGVCAWYPVTDHPGIFVGAIQPIHVAPAVRERLKGRLSTLDRSEETAFVYLVAFDLAAFDFDYVLGTDHPRLGWSERAPASSVDASLPGPDGFDSESPLVRTGRVDPSVQRRVVATFTGGFKRSHGAFTVGELAERNHASHYGFVEQGVVWSKLQPGLATLVQWVDGDLELLTWTDALAEQSWRVAHARQNGVPILEPDEAGEVWPTPLISKWAAGNWAGSVDARLSSLRASTCTLQGEQSRYLVYGYFSAATPSAMALVLSAYGCDYAMLMDMNALEHTYLSVYDHEGEKLIPHHLATGMDVLDRVEDGVIYPRFVAFSDNRDFYVVTERE